MVGALDGNKDRDPEPDLVLIDERNPAQDDPVGFQPLNALPARCRGQSDPVANLGNRQRGIFLKHRQDFTIDGVEPAVRLMERNS